MFGECACTVTRDVDGRMYIHTHNVHMCGDVVLLLCVGEYLVYVHAL